MRNNWDAATAPPASQPLAQLAYASRLLGREPSLVLHGGGNSSVKTSVTHLTGEAVDILHVKGSGWDMATIEAAGFAPLRLDRLRALLTLDKLSDTAMMNELRCASIDAGAPDPSVETLLHALLPHTAALHSHADALLALTNQPDGAEIVEKVFGDVVVVVPYFMPGFDLARRCADVVPGSIGPATVGMVLLHHGLFTFGADVEEAYRRHIDLITRAEQHLAERRAPVPTRQPPAVDPLRIARLRRDVSDAAGVPMLLTRHDDPCVRAFLARPDFDAVSQRGPATPDHVLRTKRIPLVGSDVAAYARDYHRYFAEHSDRRGTALTTLDPAPRVVLEPELGLLTAGRRARDTRIAYDIYRHTIDIIEMAEGIGIYHALPEADIFDVEYWELEQAKLRRGRATPEFAGEVALVTGAASGIGRACAQALRARGAAVVGVDIDMRIIEADEDDYLGAHADVTDPEAIDSTVRRAVDRFGGIDMVVAAAGVFPDSQRLAELDMSTWRRTMSVNVDSIAYLFSRLHPLLALASRGGRVVVVASKNAPAPGPGAAPYSASKAAAVQLARVAALEWAADGIRVNVVHPDAVFDTGLWTDEILRQRARHYGMSIEEYKRRNLLRVEITSARVAELVAVMCSDTFGATTGAQIPIDGGNARVI